MKFDFADMHNMERTPFSLIIKVFLKSNEMLSSQKKKQDLFLVWYGEIARIMC